MSTESTEHPSPPEPRPRGRTGNGSLYKRGGIFWCQYYVAGRRVQESTGTSRQTEAAAVLAKRLGGITKEEESTERATFARYLQRAVAVPTTSFRAVDLVTPLVYAWRRGDQVLYVGMSRQGLGRPLAQSHHVIRLEPTDTLDIWLCESPEHAGDLESEMICRLAPAYNNGHAPTEPVSEAHLRDATRRVVARAVDTTEQRRGV